MKRKATAIWNGNGLEGKGTLTTTSGVLNNTPYSFAMRFKNEEGREGTNPEELVAAAHGGCFAMALSVGLSSDGIVPDELKVDAVANFEKVDDHFEITNITLNLIGKVPGITPEKFEEYARKAKEGCPISRALRAVDITLNVKLV